MAIPEEIRRVARPRNTVVVLSGTKGAKRYAVRERAGYKYGPRGNPQPINGRIIGHIVDSPDARRAQRTRRRSNARRGSWHRPPLTHRPRST